MFRPLLFLFVLVIVIYVTHQSSPYHIMHIIIKFQKPMFLVNLNKLQTRALFYYFVYNVCNGVVQQSSDE